MPDIIADWHFSGPCGNLELLRPLWKICLFDWLNIFFLLLLAVRVWSWLFALVTWPISLMTGEGLNRTEDERSCQSCGRGASLVAAWGCSSRRNYSLPADKMTQRGLFSGLVCDNGGKLIAMYMYDFEEICSLVLQSVTGDTPPGNNSLPRR